MQEINSDYSDNYEEYEEDDSDNNKKDLQNENTEKVQSIEDLNIVENSFCIIASKRASGKSVLVKHLIKHMLDTYNYQFMLLFTDTHFNGDY